MKDRQPGAPGQYKAVIATAELQKMQAGEAFVITMTRDDQPLVEGTPYNKASVLPDNLAEQICPDILDPTPADAFRALQENKRPGDWLPTAEEIGAVPAVESTEYPGCFYRMVDGVQEWLKPPMVEGVEYRTTERYRGHVVYTQLFNLGMITDEKTIKTNLSVYPIRQAGIGNNSSGQVFPTPWANNNNLSDSYSVQYMVSRSSIANGSVLTIYIRVGSAASGNASGLCQVWYIYDL